MPLLRKAYRSSFPSITPGRSLGAEADTVVVAAFLRAALAARNAALALPLSSGDAYVAHSDLSFVEAERKDYRGAASEVATSFRLAAESKTGRRAPITSIAASSKN